MSILLVLALLYRKWNADLNKNGSAHPPFCGNVTIEAGCNAVSKSHLSVYELLSVKQSQKNILFLLSIWCLSADSPLQSYLMYEVVLFYIVLTII